MCYNPIFIVFISAGLAYLFWLLASFSLDTSIRIRRLNIDVYRKGLACRRWKTKAKTLHRVCREYERQLGRRVYGLDKMGKGTVRTK